ncbi:MAG TPA: hypothetical protein VJT71_10135 [Pyrinomonadaceae bacterium]|nr:hypothetical protein [Pyrinomonadaceae bacterium]
MSRLNGEKFDWTAYLLLGTLFPILLLLVLLSDRYPKTRFIKWALAAFCLLAPILALRVPFLRFIVIVALVHTAIAWGYRQRNAVSSRLLSVGLVQLAIVFFVILTSWGIASKYIWWTGADALVLGSSLSVLVFIIALLLVLVSVYDLKSAPSEGQRDPLELIGSLLAVLIIAFVSVRTDGIFGEGEMFHTITYTGVAESVRQGGWLLWDVPSHYGFLSIFTLAWIPTKTTWQSFFIVNSVLNFLIAVMLFFLFRSLRSGFLNLCFALAITLAAVFFRSGLTPYFLGPNHLPNIGGLRFFWSFVLVAILFWQYRFYQRPSRRGLLIGCVVWLIGVLWSVESAVYCSAIWLPTFAVLTWRLGVRSDITGRDVRGRLILCLKWWLLPAALLIGATLLISAYYWVRLGHGPDWQSYVEYARAYGGGFKALPINPGGEVWVLILVFCALVTTAVYMWRRNEGNNTLPLLVGTAAGLWATGSYFVSRSHPNNAHNLGPMFVGTIGLILYLLMRERLQSFWPTLVRSSLVPVLTITMVAIFANKPALTAYLNAPQGAFLGIEQLVPNADPELDNLLNSSQVEPNDPMVYTGRGELPILSGWTYQRNGTQQLFKSYKSWLPIHLYAFVPLDDKRRATYLDRFTSRVRTGGWLIEYKTEKPVYPWLSDYIKLHYTPGRTFENQNWKLTWYDYKG